MLTIYVACLIFGAVLVVMSLVSGGDTDHAGIDHAGIGHADTGHLPAGHVGIGHGTDFSHDLQTDVPQDMHVEISHDVPVAHPGDVAGHDVHLSDDAAGDHAIAHSQQTAEAARFLSFRNGVFFMTFFGLTGTVLTLLTIPGFIAFLSSLALGTFSAYTGYRVMRYLARTQSGSPVSLFELQGRLAEVTLTVTKKQSGKITLEVGGQRHQLVARAAAEASRSTFRAGDRVIISRIENGVALVIESDRLIS